MILLNKIDRCVDNQIFCYIFASLIMKLKTESYNLNYFTSFWAWWWFSIFKMIQ